MSFTIQPIGKIEVERQSSFIIQIKEEFRVGLSGLENFSHINVLFWCHQCDQSEAIHYLDIPKPYKSAPDSLGVFATRSPLRPNPVALTAVNVLDFDHQAGKIKIAYIDAEDQSPVIDLKPYSPSLDRVRNINVPDWCKHWPKWQEDSAFFDWANEFSF